VVRSFGDPGLMMVALPWGGHSPGRWGDSEAALWWLLCLKPISATWIGKGSILHPQHHWEMPTDGFSSILSFSGCKEVRVETHMGSKGLSETQMFTQTQDEMKASVPCPTRKWL
jgi:hypothetical protein